MNLLSILRSTLFAALLVMFTMTSIHANNPSEYNLVLIGVVVDDLNEYPVEGAKVELRDSHTDSAVECSTVGDGNFYFKLASERFYTLSVRNGKGELIYTKTIDTLDNDKSIINDTLIVAAEDL